MIEVMAAMLILSMVCIAYSENQVGAIQLVKATRFRDTAIMLASMRMSDINFLIQTKGVEFIKDEERGEFDQEKFPTYSWRTTKKPIPPPDFSALMSLAKSSGEGEDDESGEDGESSAPTAG